MKIIVLIFLAIIVKNSYSIKPKEQIVQLQVKEGKAPGGIWKERTEWKAHWVKHWEVKKIYVPVWRKVWGPVEVKEWIPFPQAPPMADWGGHPQHPQIKPY